MEKYYYNSPIGILEFLIRDNALLSLKIADKTEVIYSDTIFSKKIKSQLDEYFSFKRKNFDIALNPLGTVFQKKVWAELIKIPYGKTSSYSGIAKNIGHNNAQRAVGSACRKNPIMIIIPCHRIILKNGSLGKFAFGVQLKEKLLKMESSI